MTDATRFNFQTPEGKIISLTITDKEAEGLDDEQLEALIRLKAKEKGLLKSSAGSPRF